MISYEDYNAFQATVSEALRQPASRITSLLRELSIRLSNPIKFKGGVFFEEFSKLSEAANVLRLAGFHVPEAFKLYSDAHLTYCLFLCGLLEGQDNFSEGFVAKTLFEVEYEGLCLSLGEHTAIQALVYLLDL